MKRSAFALSAAVAAVAILAGPAAGADPVPYKVSDGTKVDQATLGGWRAWRALACERCHGAEQEGLVGPSLVESLKVLSREEFEQTLMAGRPERGMPSFANSQMISKNLDGLYAYLKGRSDGSIQPGRLEPLQK